MAPPSRNQPKPGRPRKAASSVPARRKAEKTALLSEIKTLQHTMESLQRRLRPHDRAQVDKHLRHQALQRALKPSALAAAEMQSLYSEFLSTRLQSPAQSYIHLTMDVGQRCLVLSAMKAQRLHLAKRFLEHRFNCVDLNRMLSEKQEFDSLDGGYCAIHCDVLRFNDAQSLKQVFDSVLFNLKSVEMVVTDHTGAVAVRIDNDDSDAMDGIAQVRMVSTLSSGLQMDSNFVLFSQYYEDLDEGESALLAVDFVDRDDLYPFQPHERPRKDPSAFCRLKCLPRKHESDPLVVVMQRWTTMHLRKPDFEVSKEVWQALKVNMNAWSETMQQNVLAGVQAGRGGPVSDRYR